MTFQDEIFEIGRNLEKQSRENLKYILLNKDCFHSIDPNNEELVAAEKRKSLFFNFYFKENPEKLEELIEKMRKSSLYYIGNN